MQISASNLSMNYARGVQQSYSQNKSQNAVQYNTIQTSPTFGSGRWNINNITFIATCFIAAACAAVSAVNTSPNLKTAITEKCPALATFNLQPFAKNLNTNYSVGQDIGLVSFAKAKCSEITKLDPNSWLTLLNPKTAKGLEPVNCGFRAMENLKMAGK